ncbi:PD-(D/E)XK motif protein [Acidipila sp. EB88]|uniref:PD-(D/E)XK motif protein n=1 Tax=Acidipila sp. EB88 TaxID=2305226 RepID=UPI000F5FFEDD|nr:PD-(D/E)XK motif protein [Acidipila sp. EB88]RRA49308.1 PD-(D/E)XK motif protein [Acidipila sp. EB88]
MNLLALFQALESPDEPGLPIATFSVAPVEGFTSFMVGKDGRGRGALLVAGAHKVNLPAIKLQAVEAYFGLRCSLQTSGQEPTSTRLSIIQCPVSDDETIRFFFSICATLVSLLGDNPTSDDLWASVNRIASLFQKLLRAPKRSLDGLFGEIFIIWQSVNPLSAIRLWRLTEEARFDFVGERLRLDVKTTSSHHRSHVLSFEQTNPPADTIGIFASLFVEQVNSGTSLGDLIEDLEERLSSEPEQIFRLQEQLAATLGATLHTALAAKFDVQLTTDSLRFFKAVDVPAIRGESPMGVSDIHFRSDFTQALTSELNVLIQEAPELAAFSARY